MTLDERLNAFVKKSLNEARRSLREAKEMRNLVKEVVYFGSDDQKLQLIQAITRVRPDLMPPLINAPVPLFEQAN